MTQHENKEQQKLIREIDRQTCIERLKSVMSHSDYEYELKESDNEVELFVNSDAYNGLVFVFEYEGGASCNQTEHLLEDIATLMKIGKRYGRNPFVSMSTYLILPEEFKLKKNE